MPAHRLLVIDDDARIHQTFKAILAKYPIEFESTLSAGEVLETLRSESYSLVLLDIIMPPLSAIALKSSPPPTQTASEFVSISRAMGNMVFHRRTATLLVHTKMRVASASLSIKMGNSKASSSMA